MKILPQTGTIILMPEETAEASKIPIKEWQKLFNRPRIFTTPEWRQKPSDNYTYKGKVLSINHENKIAQKDPPIKTSERKRRIIIYSTIIISAFVVGLIFAAVVTSLL